MIVVPVVNRTNYSKIKPILQQLSKHDIEVELVVGSSALIDDFGTVKKDIESDGFGRIFYMDSCLRSDSHAAMSKNNAISMIQFSTYLENNKPEMALVVGDRFDMLAFASCCALQNVPIAHIQGGERSGTIDDKIRFAITALSDYHFPSTDVGARNIINCNVDLNKVFCYGCPAVEYVVQHCDKRPLNLDGLRKYSKKNVEPFLEGDYIVAQLHPNTVDVNDVKMNEALTALQQIGENTIIMYPNIDATEKDIVADMRRFKQDKFYYFRHFSLDIFVNLISNCKCFIGNSSAIIRESASYGVPAINLGSRQANRERNDNVFDCEFDSDKIVNLYDKIKDLKLDKTNIYYKKDCAKNIAKEIISILSKETI